MKQTIKLLSPTLEQLGDLTEYVSLIYTRSWHSVGDFQLIVHREAPLVNEIKKDYFIALDKNKIAIIKHREIQLDQNGKVTENWLFRGWTLKGLAMQRITVPPSNTAYDNKSGDAETVMKHYIDRHLVNPVDPDRKIPNLIIAPNQNRGSQISWQSRLKVVSEELENISLASGIGWDIVIDTENNLLVFDVFAGLDKSINQEERSPVYFSPEFGNVKTQSFSDSDLNMRNVGYVGGQGEGVEREIIELGVAAGLNRYETFIDARDIGGEDEEGNQITPEEEIRLLTERGQQRLAEMANELYFEAEVMSPIPSNTFTDKFQTFVGPHQPNYRKVKDTQLVGPFIYQRDYNLGDTVTIMNREWGFIVDRRITEFTETHESGGFQLEAVFGQKRPTILSKIKNELRNYEGVLKQ